MFHPSSYFKCDVEPTATPLQVIRAARKRVICTYCLHDPKKKAARKRIYYFLLDCHKAAQQSFLRKTRRSLEDLAQHIH